MVDKDNLLTLKYYNDTAWYYYSLITILPLGYFFFYRLLFPKDFSEATDEKPFPPTITDRFIQLFLVYGIVYYIFDLY